MPKKIPRSAGYFFGVPGGIRTPDLLIRSQTLYPAELLAHDGGEQGIRTLDTLLIRILA